MSKVVSNTFYYTVGIYALQVVLFFFNLHLRQLLGPENLGVWAFLNIVLTYLVMTDFGVMQVVLIRMSSAYHEGRSEDMRWHMETGLGFSLFNGFVVSASVVLYGVVAYAGNPVYLCGFLYLAGTFLLMRISNSLVYLFRARGEFKILTAFNALSMIVWVGLGILMVSFYDIFGLYLSTFISLGLGLLFLLSIFLRNEIWRPRFRPGEWAQYLAPALMFFSGSLISNAIRFTDSLWIRYTLNDESLGYYTIGFTFAGYVWVTIDSASMVILNHLQQVKATTHSEEATIRSADRIMLMLSVVILPLLIASITAAAQITIPILANKFESKIALVVFMTAMVFPLALAHIPVQLLQVFGKLRAYAIASAISLVLMVVLLVGVSRGSLSLMSVAVVSAITYTLYFTLLYFACHKDLATVWSRYGLLVGCLAYFWIAQYFTMAGHSSEGLGITESILDVVMRYTLFMALYAPAALYYEYRTKELSRLTKTLRDILRAKSGALNLG